MNIMKNHGNPISNYYCYISFVILDNIVKTNCRAFVYVNAKYIYNKYILFYFVDDRLGEILYVNVRLG